MIINRLNVIGLCGKYNAGGITERVVEHDACDDEF